MAHVEPEIADYVRQIDAIKRDARALVEGLSDERFNRRPEADRWSPGQCVEHLNITHRAMLPRMQEAAQRVVASGRRARGATRHALLIRWFIRDMEPPPKRRYRTGSVFVPPLTLARPETLAEFLKLHDELLRLLETVNGHDLAAASVRSPFAGWLKYNLGSAIAIQTAHDRRHLWQARAAVDASRGAASATLRDRRPNG